MWINRLKFSVPRRQLYSVIVFSALTSSVLVFFGLALFDREVNPGPPHDVRFLVLGQAYLPQLGKAYAAAWEEGAKQLEAGKGVSEALDTVAKTWSAKRTELYDQVFTPEFSMIVEEGFDDAKLGSRERSALAAAWRGLSRGLAK